MTTSFAAGQRLQAANMPAPYAQSAAASGDTTINSTTLTDLTGASITISTRTTAATVFVTGTFDMQVSTTGTAIATGHCNVDGTDQTAQATSSLTTVGQRSTAVQTWVVTLSGATNHTIKLQGALSAASGSMNIRGTHTKLSIVVFDF
jgi:hypothetical protein